MPRMSWPSWRRTRTVTRAAGMATGAGEARHCWSRGAVSRRREARTGQPGAEQQGRLGARRRASTARDSRGADPRGTAGARVLRAGAPGRRDRSCGCRARSSARCRMRRGRARLSRGVSTWRVGAPVGRHQGATDGARGRRGRAASRHSRAQAHGSGRCAAARAARQDARRPGLARAERRLGCAGGPDLAWRASRERAAVLDERAGAAGRLAEAGGAWRPGGLAAVAGEPWASAPGQLRACCNRWWGRRMGTPFERRRLAWGPAAAGGEEGAARPRRGKELGASQQRSARQGPSWKKLRPGARRAQERWREER
jgi:hypothetical protein